MSTQDDEANEINTSAKANGTASSTVADPDESSVTMVDYLENERMLQEEYDAVLGASDEKACTYTRGAIKRQALYSCLTCCPEGRRNLSKCAGICLACSLHCHANHELVELYTKRNFRCDCPTERFEDNRCLMNLTLDERKPRNSNNLYNQNFQGVYCKCHRPYPDPERNDETAMIQCTICEDWYHLEHINAPHNAETLSEVATEMVCDTCMTKHPFLLDYIGMSLNLLENTDETLDAIEVDDQEQKLRIDLDKSTDVALKSSKVALEENKGDVINSISNENETTANTSTGNRGTVAGTPNCKRIKIDKENDSEIEMQENEVEEPISKCRRPAKTTADKCDVATFWDIDLRTNLCQCETCMAMYKEQGVEFLIDIDDSAKTYEERGIRRAAEEPSAYEQGIAALSNLDRMQQVDAITEYNHMKDQLKEYLATFVAENRVVTEADINSFFERMRNQRAGGDYLRNNIY